MSWQEKAIELYRRFGTPVKFAAKLVLGAIVPGGSAVVDLVGQLLDCLHETVKDNIEIDEGRIPPATAADLKRVEEMLDVLSGDLAGLTEQVAGLEGLPDAAMKILDIALKTDDRCRAALHKLDTLAQGFDVLRKQNEALLRGQGYAAGLLEEMLPLMRRVASVADFVEELRAEGVSAPEFRSALAEFREGVQAMARGRVAEADARLERLARSRPTTAAAAVALAAAQTAKQDLPAAQKTLVRAARLRPQDTGLAELSRRVTRATQTTPPARQVPPQETPRVGAVLDGWRLELLLGRGGWGQVFKARRGDEVRALKVMHPDLSHDPAFVERFKAEILTLAGLRGHKHLVEIHGFGKDADCWYFLMEFIEGVSLEQYLMRKGPLPLARAIPLFALAADGLSLAHARGVVHRDVKPANILLRKPDGRPVVVDFGLAVLAVGSGLTKAGQFAGHTPMFAAPEQLRGKPADARTDVYALGASLFYALNFDKPHFREPDQFDPENAPEALREILARALNPNPERRYANAAEFLAALEKQRLVEEARREREEAERRRREEEEADRRREAAEQERLAAERRQREEQEQRVRLQQERETLLARRYEEMLDRTRGKLGGEDKASLVALCREFGIPPERADIVVREVRARRKQASRAKEERRPASEPDCQNIKTGVYKTPPVESEPAVPRLEKENRYPNWNNSTWPVTWIKIWDGVRGCGCLILAAVVFVLVACLILRINSVWKP